MTSKARADIHKYLPALRKLDSTLIETLDSMVNTEFWYSEVGLKSKRKNENTRECKRWWLPSPKVPKEGLSSSVRNNLFEKGNVVYQIFKATKSMNETVLLDMPIPTIIKDSLPKMLSSESASIDEIFASLRLVTEHAALETVNRLEAAIYAWKEKTTEQGSSEQRGLINDQIKSKYPNLPQSFLDATKIQYGKDIGHAIPEAYSRILASLAFRILSRIEEILQEDSLSNNPSSPTTPSCSLGSKNLFRTTERLLISSRLRHSLIHDMNKANDGTTDPKDSSYSLM
ncbi:unnamed protein product [Arabis nemorensis]|uniref:PRONE domain-containing protein n=1 Tax=Arabis nemorensis TaxID=586526 RepID=A0A565BKS9_9BRAS|nr:unnamed protein product [Arabis nemorensis]